MKEAFNECNLTYPIFNISSLNSKMTRYDPNAVPIMQHWSKWPFHTEEWKKINPTPPPVFFILPHYSLHTKVAPAIGAACTYVYIICTKQNAACQINWPRHRKQSLHVHTSNSFCSQACCISLWVCLFCLPTRVPPPTHPQPPPRPAPPPRPVCRQTPSRVKSQKLRQVTKTGPDFPAHQPRCRG